MSVLNVFYSTDPVSPVAVGRLAMHRGRIYFEYDAAFLKTGLELSPFMLPARAGAVAAEPTPWDGLFGLFNDSLPDGWGLLLMDRHLKSLGVDTRFLTPLDRLAYMGSRAMGALTYEPAREVDGDAFEVDIASMAASAIEIYAGHASEVLPQMARAGGSPAGARPKILVHLSGERMISGESEAPAGFEPWIVKFFAGSERPDTGRIEYAYALMARDAGITMPETRLFEGDGSAWFGIRRFDRDGTTRIHMHTLGGLVDADFRMPSLDYTDVLRVTQQLTRNETDVERAFALMAFNVLAHNRDDHSKNFSFLMDANGEWRLAPAYDLTCSRGMNGEHTTAVAGEGRNPGEAHMLKAGEAVGLKTSRMRRCIERVRSAIARWPEWCDRAGIAEADRRFPPVPE
ncbi:MAG TPA: type II toxin-antitoxin system HipA family toxin [Mariprofundaceae bacterium]|nr:type II toxin-antitoxin system HipA family toxin [Mariprofundaceae bacterium]